MRQRFIIFFCPCLLLFVLGPFASSYAADIADPSSESMNLSDCIDMAHQKNPDFLSYYESFDSKKYLRSKTLKTMLPKVTFSETIFSDIDDDYEQYTSALNLSQTLFQGGAKYNQYQISKIEAENAYLEIQRQGQLLSLDVKKAWFELLQAIKILEENEQSIERIHKMVNDAQTYYEEGLIWSNDVLQSQIKLIQMKQSQIQALNNVILAKSKLNLLLNRDVNDPIDPTDDFKYKKYNMDSYDFKDIAFTNRPDYKQANLDWKSSHSSINVARSNLWPSIETDLDISRSQEDKILLKNGAESASATVSLDWEIWNWGATRDDIQSAEAIARRDQLKIEQLKNQILYEIKEAKLDVQAAEQKVLLLQDSLEKTKENYEVTIVRFQEQQGTATDVLNAQDLLTNIRKSYYTALTDYNVAIAQLEFILGLDEGFLTIETD